MKRVETSTDWIFIKAYTGSEWDDCDFAVIRLTDEWRTAMQQRLETVRQFQGDNTFYTLAYHDAPAGFFANPEKEDYNLIEALLGEGQGWTFIETDREELDSLPVPENDLSYYQLTLTQTGTACFEAWGKNINEHFYTDYFSVSEVIAKK